MSPAKPKLSAVFEGFRDPMVLALGLSQTIGYGTLYYAYGVLAKPMAAEFGVGVDLFFLIFTGGLLAGGLVAPMIGGRIDRHGARPVMLAGSLVAGLSQFMMAFSPNVWVFGIAVVVMEIAACMVLYEAAFAALTQAFGHAARSRITAITLMAGFASTLFWPVTQWLSDMGGWRNTWIIFAALNALLCSLLHGYGLRRAVPRDSARQTALDTAAEALVLTGDARRRAILLYAVAICTSGIVFSALPLHMLGLIAAQGFTAQQAAFIAMVMGPCQVLARIAEILIGPRFDAMTTGRVALLSLPVAMLALLAASVWPMAAFLFAGLYGISQGLISIARGTVPLQLFGVRGYATLQGRITGLRLLLNAGAPAALAFLMASTGANGAVLACFGAALLAAAAFLALPRPRVSV